MTGPGRRGREGGGRPTQLRCWPGGGGGRAGARDRAFCKPGETTTDGTMARREGDGRLEEGVKGVKGVERHGRMQRRQTPHRAALAHSLHRVICRYLG